MVETVYVLAAEYQFVIFEKIVTLLIYINLQGAVEGVCRQLVVIGNVTMSYPNLSRNP